MGSNKMYPGMGYGLDYEQQSALGFSYKSAPKTGEFGIPTDPRTANQLQAVSAKLATGAKSVEISAVQSEVFEYIPKQQFEEIRRLKKLVGAEITLHGPLVEATGITQQGWDESKRLQAERQLFNAVEKASMVGDNTVFTVHSTAGLPEMRTKVIDEKTGKETITELWVVDEREGKFSSIKLPQKDYFHDKQPTITEELDKMNEENWNKLLTQVSFHAHQGQGAINGALNIGKKEELKGAIPEMNIEKLYKAYKDGEQAKKIESSLSPDHKEVVNEVINNINYGEIYVKDAYKELQNLFNKAYLAAEKAGDAGKKDLKRLEEYRQEVSPKLKDFDKDPTKISEFADEVVKGVRVLSTLSKAPELLKPLNEFAIEKASQTYAGVALRAYKEFGEKAPIISIENPPAGGGLSRADDLRNLVDASRKTFVQQLMDEKKVSESEAKKIADKLIGVTWDVGHINMIRKFGYGEEELIKETKKIAPYVKHVHLSDNFGLEHTELPMGMGNVPTKPMLDAISKYNKQVKKVIETGGWYQHFKKSPLGETFQAFGSQTYGSVIPNWAGAYNSGGGYFAGRGMNPDFHHSIYGSGFSNLPVELGGQMAGRNRLSGAPMEG